jgi:hypothetical protein
MGYEDLSREELLVIAGYFLKLKIQPKTDFVIDDRSVIDDATYYRLASLETIDSRIKTPSDLDNLLRSDKPLSKDMRGFIGDVIAGKAKMGRSTTISRDRQFYEMVMPYVNRGISLSSSDNKEVIIKDGAADMAIKDMKRTAEAQKLEFNNIFNEGVVKGGYTKIKNENWVKDKENGYLWVVTTHYKDNGDIEYVSEGYVV